MTKDSISDHIRLAIRRLRIERGLRVRDVAERARIPMGSYSCMETGHYKIGTDKLFRILHALGAPIDAVWPTVPGENGPAEGVSDRYIRKVLTKARRQRPELPSVEDAVDAVCRVYGVTLEELSSPSRLRRLAEARTVASMLVEGQPHLSKSQLGHVLLRGPSTLEHCAKRLRKRLPRDRQLEVRIEEDRRLFGKSKKRRRGRGRSKSKRLRKSQPNETPKPQRRAVS